MRYLSILLTICFLFTACKPEPEMLREDGITEIFEEIYLSKEDRLYTDKHTHEPVNGTFTAHYESGEKQGELTFEEGEIAEGTIFYESGAAWVEYSTIEGKKHMRAYTKDGTLVQLLVREHPEYKLVESKTWYEDGTPRHEMSSDVIRSWYANGKVKDEAHFEDGKQHGRVAKWHENGQLAGECFYYNNELHGAYKEWDEEGNLITEREYDMGELVYTSES